MSELEELKQKRDAMAKEISALESSQSALKVLLASVYGAIANRHFRFYDIRLSESITHSGQVAIRWVAKDVNEYLNKLAGTKDEEYVIYSDTDSIFINMFPFVEKYFDEETDSDDKIANFVDLMCKKKVEKVIEESYAKLAEYMGAYENAMVMKREKISKRGIWTGKKKYVVNIIDNEGVRLAEPKMKITGIEAIKSSTPKCCRDKIIAALKIIMTGDREAYYDYADEFKNEFMNLPVEEIAFPRGLRAFSIAGSNSGSQSPLEKYGDKLSIYKRNASCPIHVRGSLIWNHFYDKGRFSNSFPKINSGDRIRFTYLKVPNEFNNENVIAFPAENCDLDGTLDDCVDRLTQFEKAFLSPIKMILEKIGWQAERKADLDAFFV